MIRSCPSIHKFGTARCERLGKCFCPSRAPQRDGNHKGLGTPLPSVQGGYSSPALHALWRRAACLWARLTRGPMTQGPWGVLRTRLVDPMTGISRRYGGRAEAAQCRCGSRPHRSRRVQGPSRPSKVWPSMCSSLRSVTPRTTAVDKAPRGATASSLSASCQ